jgi:hypothetical protein
MSVKLCFEIQHLYLRDHAGSDDHLGLHYYLHSFPTGLAPRNILLLKEQIRHDFYDTQNTSI